MCVEVTELHELEAARLSSASIFRQHQQQQDEIAKLRQVIKNKELMTNQLIHDMRTPLNCAVQLQEEIADSIRMSDPHLY